MVCTARTVRCHVLSAHDMFLDHATNNMVIVHAYLVTMDTDVMTTAPLTSTVLGVKKSVYVVRI